MRIKCPNCDSINHRVVHTDEEHDRIIKICNCQDCPTQFNVSFGDPKVIHSETRKEVDNAETN